MPANTHLAYSMWREFWWAKLPGHPAITDEPAINVCASTGGTGVAWEFQIHERDIGDSSPAIRVCVFDDAWQAFAQIPEFFTALATVEGASLASVRALLDSLGAVDETDRVGPCFTVASAPPVTEVPS
jgi:hypothetical protein